MRFLFTTLQDLETEFYGRVGRQLERLGHEVAHVTWSAPDAAALRDKGHRTWCLPEAMDGARRWDRHRRRGRPDRAAVRHADDPRHLQDGLAVLRASRRSGASQRTVRHFLALEQIYRRVAARDPGARGGQRDDPHGDAPDRRRARHPRAVPLLHDLPRPAAAVSRHAARADRRRGRAARAVAGGARGDRGFHPRVHHARASRSASTASRRSSPRTSPGCASSPVRRCCACATRPTSTCGPGSGPSTGARSAPAA